MKSKIKKLAAVICAIAVMACMFAIPAQADVGDHYVNEIEPNNSMASADYVYNDATICGELGDYDIDYFVFDLNVTSHVYILFTAQYSSLRFALKDSNDNTLYVSDESWYNGKPFDEIENYSLPAGRYYIALLNYDNSFRGNTYLGHIEIEYNVLYGSWQYDGIGWYFAYENGGYPYDQWLIIDDEYYYFDARGYMVTGWVLDGSWYYMDANGNLSTGWQQIGGTWYYFNEGGAMVTGWQQLGGTWYYFNPGGDMATGWKQIGGTWYYFNSSGAMVTGWQSIGGAWYYFNSSGAMVTGWQSIGGTWYYFNPGGDMATGWRVIGNYWYYFYADGSMAANTWIDGCWLNSSGAWA